jgi:hypothetical protein
MHSICLRYALIGALFVPAISYSGGNDKKIQELREAQFKKQTEISDLSDVIRSRYQSLYTSQETALHWWGLARSEESEEESKKSLELFLDKLVGILTLEADVNKALDQEPLYANACADLQFALMRVALERIYIDNVVRRYRSCVNELIGINQLLVKLNRA